MAPDQETQALSIESPRQGLAGLVSTALALSLVISIAVAAMLVAAGIWLERF